MKKRLETSPEKRDSAQKFYTHWHSQHQECSQFHRCRPGYCQRVKKLKGNDDTTTDKTCITCRHRWPLCRKICLCCAKSHSYVNSDICKKCLEENKPLPTIPEHLPFEIIEPARVEHSTRYDKKGNKKGNFMSSAPRTIHQLTLTTAITLYLTTATPISNIQLILAPCVAI